MMSTNDKPNCFEKTEAGGAFFIFHQITDELPTKHFPRLRTTVGTCCVAAGMLNNERH